MKGLVNSIILLLLGVACTPKPVQSTTVEKYQLSCGHSNPHRDRLLIPQFIVSYLEDSLADTTLRFASNEMNTPLDSAFSRGDLSNYFIKNLVYPEMLLEMEIQGNWYYAMNFENGIFTSYRLLKSPADSRPMEIEIEKCMKKQFNSLRYTRGGKNKIVVRFIVKLMDP